MTRLKVTDTAINAVASAYCRPVWPSWLPSTDVPYIIDNAWGAPFIGTDIRKIGCDVITYSG